MTTRRVNMDLDKDLWKQVGIRAIEEGIDKKDLVKKALINYLKEDEEMLTEERLEEIMTEEVEKVIERYEGNKENFRTSAIEAVDPLNETQLSEEEVRKLYREWLEESLI